MRPLQRLDPGPACLSDYDWKSDGWGGNPINPNRVDRQEIWAMLETMQEGCCAYCEAMLKPSRHIDHFVARSYKGSIQGKELTFEWSNLFGSCTHNDCCGHYKDNAKNPCSNYDPLQLIKPDEDDPWEFLVFAVDGFVSPRDGLSAPMRERALLTINVFNLNHARHVACRKGSVNYLINQSSQLLWLDELDAANAGYEPNEIWKFYGAEVEKEIMVSFEMIFEYRSAAEQWLQQNLSKWRLSQ